jgi:hypothetical protein
MDTLRSSFIRRAIPVWAICLSLSAIAFSADNKPNLSGSWELNVPKSDLGGTPINNAARMTLSDDGKTMMTRDYERKSANNTQKRHEIYEKR